jgi:hypothetical protein
MIPLRIGRALYSSADQTPRIESSRAVENTVSGSSRKSRQIRRDFEDPPCSAPRDGSEQNVAVSGDAF